MSIYRSRIHEFIPRETLLKLSTICENQFYNHTNDKVSDMVDVLNSSGIDYVELGPGTHRFAILVDGYAVKIALDSNGVEDNWAEYVMSSELQPYVTKVYECNGLLSVHEYITLISEEEFLNRREEVLEIVRDIGSEYLLGDIGARKKSFYNWGTRDEGELVCLDFAYIFKIRGVELFCDYPDRKDEEYICQGQLHYDKDCYDLVCEKCGRTHGFLSVRRRIVEQTGYQYLTDYITHNAIRTDKAVLVIDDGIDNTSSMSRAMSEEEMYDIAFDEEKGEFEKFYERMIPDKFFKSKEEFDSMTEDERRLYRQEVETHVRRFGLDDIFQLNYDRAEMQANMYEEQLKQVQEVDYEVFDSGLVMEKVPDKVYPGGYTYSQLLTMYDLSGHSSADDELEMTMRGIHRVHLVDNEVYDPNNPFDLDFDRLHELDEERRIGNMVDWTKYPIEKVVFLDWENEPDAAYIRLVFEHRNIPATSVYDHPNYIRAVKEDLDYELVPKPGNIDNAIFFNDYDVVIHHDPSRKPRDMYNDINDNNDWSGPNFETDNDGNVWDIGGNDRVPVKLYGHVLTDEDYYKFYAFGKEYFMPDDYVAVPNTPEDKYSTSPEKPFDSTPQTVDVVFTPVEEDKTLVENEEANVGDTQQEEQVVYVGYDEPKDESIKENIKSPETKEEKTDIYYINENEQPTNETEVVKVDSVPINKHGADDNSGVPLEVVIETNEEDNMVDIDIREFTKPTLIYTNTDHPFVQNTTDDILEWRGFEFHDDTKTTDDSCIGIVHGASTKIVVICKEEQQKTIIEDLNIDNIRKCTKRSLEELDGILGDYINIPMDIDVDEIINSINIPKATEQNLAKDNKMREELKAALSLDTQQDDDSVKARFINEEE